MWAVSDLCALTHRNANCYERLKQMSVQIKQCTLEDVDILLLIEVGTKHHPLVLLIDPH